METSLTALFKEYNKLLDSQFFNVNDLDYSLVDYHVQLLKSIDVVDTGCISIFDLYQRKHVYYSPKYEKVLGWNPLRAMSDIDYTNNLIHPEDLPAMIKASMYYISFGFSMPDKTKSRDYKTIYDYRVQGLWGKYVRIIEQQIPLEFDKSGNVWLALSMLDLSPDHDLESPFRGRLVNHKTGELFLFPPNKDLPKVSASLSNREKEILSLIAGGLISKEIADKLFISVNTVNTHRQRIIEKLNVSNTYEAIRYAHEKGLF